MSKHVALLSALAAGLGLARVSSAAVYTVNNTNISGSGSLSLALSQAQSDPNATINITTGLGAIVLTSPLPPIENNLVINGNGTTISGADSNRIFFVNAPNGSVLINSLTLLDGVAQGGNGGAGYGGGGGGGGLGGAIFLNAGSLTVNSVAFATNSARGGAGSLGFDSGLGQSGGGGGGGGLDFAGGAGGSQSVPPYGFVVGPGGGGGARTSAGAVGNGNNSNAGMGGGSNGGLGGELGLSGNAGNGASPALADGGGGGGGLAADTGNGGNGGNGSDFGGGGGAGSSSTQNAGVAGNGGFSGGGGGGANAFADGYSGGNGGFGGGGGGGGNGGDAGGAGGSGGFGGGNGAAGTTGNAGGGLGAGGAIFARLGSTLTLQDCTFTGDTVNGGATGGSPAMSGSAMGQALFLGASVCYSVSAGTNTLGETIAGGNDANAQGNFIKAGAGKLIFTNAESYYGNTVISNGTLEVVNNILPSQNVIISSNGILDYYYTNRILGPAITYTGTGTLRIDGSGGDVVFGPGATYIDFSPGAWIDVEAGLLTGSSSYQGYWSNNYASINVASNATFNAVEAGYAGAMQIDALTGAGNFVGGYQGNAHNGLSTLTIGIAGGSGTFSGELVDNTDGRLGIVKVGAGTEILSGQNNSYSGNTVVNGGLLVLTGDAGTGTVTVASGALAGTGTISGAVTITNNGILAPGYPTGTLTINNSLNLAANTLISLNSGASSKITGLASVTYGGTLTITNLGAPLSVGDSFNLFSTAAWSGNFSAIQGTAGNGLGFSFNPTNGVLTVVATTPSLTGAAHAGSLTVNWPASLTGWILQSQTNSGAQGLGTNWTDVLGSTTVNSLSFPIAGTHCVFFRLQPPAP